MAAAAGDGGGPGAASAAAGSLSSGKGGGRVGPFSCPVCEMVKADTSGSSGHRAWDGPGGVFCGDEFALAEHVRAAHSSSKRSLELVCPVCASAPGGDPELRSRDVLQHMRARHDGSVRSVQTYDDAERCVQRRIRAAKPGQGALLTILGSGPSTGCPRVDCLQRRPMTCATCLDAVRNPLGPNTRNNPSFLIRLPNGANIVIDCGKTFRQAVLSSLAKCVGAGDELLDLFELNHVDFAERPVNYHSAERRAALAAERAARRKPRKEKAAGGPKPASASVASAVPPTGPAHGGPQPGQALFSSMPMVESVLPPYISHLDAVVLTHNHADAFLGLDDLREFTDNKSLTVYSRKTDVATLRGAFPYLVDRGRATGSGYVSDLRFTTFDVGAPPKECEDPDATSDPASRNTICGLDIWALNMHHGPPCTCTCFVFGSVVYMSDVSNVPQRTRARILELVGGTIDILIIDCLCRVRSVNSHFNLPETLEEIRRLRPRRAFLVGMSHDMNYARENERLRALEREEGLHVELAHDGMVLYTDSVQSQPLERDDAPDADSGNDAGARKP